MDLRNNTNNCSNNGSLTSNNCSNNGSLTSNVFFFFHFTRKPVEDARLYLRNGMSYLTKTNVFCVRLVLLSKYIKKSISEKGEIWHVLTDIFPFAFTPPLPAPAPPPPPPQDQGGQDEYIECAPSPLPEAEDYLQFTHQSEDTPQEMYVEMVNTDEPQDIYAEPGEGARG